MAEEASRKEIDEMIGECINAVRLGYELSGKEIRKFEGLCGRISRAKKRSFQDLFSNTFRYHNEQAILADAINLGIVKDPKQKEFVFKAKIVIETECRLMGLKHLFSGSAGEPIEKYFKKSIEERWEILKSVKIDLKKAIYLQKRVDQLVYKCIKTKRGFIREKLDAERKMLGKKLEEEVGRISSAMQGHLTLEAYKPSERQMLVNALRNERQTLGKRELEMLQDALQRLDRMNTKHRMPRKRLLHRI